MDKRASFDLERHGDLLRSVLDAVAAVRRWSPKRLTYILRQHPLPNGKTLSKSQLLDGYAQLCEQMDADPDPRLIRRLRLKPTRTISGVAPVAVLTEPYACPGTCIFCPDVAGMPKSYLPDEPGAMRAANHDFDPYNQTAARIAVMSDIGHNVDKIELLILGGTWSSYPEAYQACFVRRCLDAMNDFEAETLEEAQQINESSEHRNVGLVVETRPDCITIEEVRRLRWLGVTKVQLGVQSLDDEILTRNRRGHTLADTRRAMRLLRLAGFKIVVHWMPNLLGATPERDLADFRRMWVMADIRPDEMKIYPTALLEGTELYECWQNGSYQPYDEETMVALLARCKTLIPPYCRVNRLMRDIPAPNIVAGVKKSNLRQIVQQRMAREGLACRCIRCREVRGRSVDTGELTLERIDYETDVTSERFLQYVTPSGRLAGFLRLSLPHPGAPRPVEGLEGCAMIREIHVYGPALELGARGEQAVQHAGLGTQLIQEARRVARQAGFPRLAVIAAVGTRAYYRERGFELVNSYMIGDA
ncbi:MAG TPA: tRNA uridine(34) 5-carboxymethylaminomethyl modification radical SAM/GNAT enzyme Elp3 [Chloroflexi bacterium]|nr:tRNA uridine(34) 5-carboxymethylaminomethyl modification radical SAM/GNAT enzyme Elp3 [Chloroflexota bacterium]